MGKDSSKLYIFIIWEKSRNFSEKILNDLSQNFTINDVYEISWNKNNFLRNLKRFYGKSLPDAKKKAEVCGTGPFLLVIVSDNNPKFLKPSRTGFVFENDLVNKKIVECKKKYRDLIGIDYTVHSSQSENETNHNLTLIFGKNLFDFQKTLSGEWSGTIKKISTELIGDEGWKNMEQLLYVLNGTSNYVILRNFEGMPEEFDYRDIDLLADDEKLAFIVNSDFSIERDNSRTFRTKIANQTVIFNPNYLGDHYYDIKWERQILKNRIFHKKGFYIPSNEDYFYTLYYHVLFHGRWRDKKEISEKYKKKLIELASELNIKNFKKELLEDLEKSKEFVEEYMTKMSYRHSFSISYRIRHNEINRLSKTAILLAKTQGIKFLIIAGKDKIKFVLGLRK